MSACDKSDASLVTTRLLRPSPFAGSTGPAGDNSRASAHFGALQTMRAQHRGMEFSREKGRPIDDQHFAQLERHLQDDFADFRANSNSGTVK